MARSLKGALLHTSHVVMVTLVVVGRFRAWQNVLDIDKLPC